VSEGSSTLTPSHFGYATSTGWAYDSTDSRVGHIDYPWPINDVDQRGFLWFNVPSSIRGGTVLSAKLYVWVQDTSQWNSLLDWVLLEHLGTLTWTTFASLSPSSWFDALLGGSVGYEPKGAQLVFTISPSLFYLFQQYQVGFSLRAQPEVPSGALGNQTNQVTLNGVVLVVTWQ